MRPRHAAISVGRFNRHGHPSAEVLRRLDDRGIPYGRTDDDGALMFEAQVSWFVVLFGAETSFAHQNVHLYEFEPDCRKVSLSFKKLISLRITQVLVKNFSQGKSPLTAASIAQAVEMPMLLVNEILLELVESGIISGITIHEHEGTAYQPARDTDRFEYTVCY